MAEKALNAVKDDLLEAVRDMRGDPSAQERAFKLVEEADRIEAEASSPTLSKVALDENPPKDEGVSKQKKEKPRYELPLIRPMSQPEPGDRAKAVLFVVLCLLCPPLAMYFLYLETKKV